MTPINYNKRIIEMIEENIQENVMYLNSIKENMSDENFNKESLIKFTENDIQFMLNLKEKIENGTQYYVF